MTCPNLPGCSLAGLLVAKPALRVWQTFFCESAYHRCERLKLFRAGRLVPTNLLPNGTQLAVPLRPTFVPPRRAAGEPPPAPGPELGGAGRRDRS